MKVKIDSYIVESLGACLQTALRKSCDNKITSIAFNVAHGMKQSDWVKYIKQIEPKIKEYGLVFKSYEEVVLLIKENSTNRGRNESHLLLALRLVFELFDDSDWQAYCGYMWRE